MSSIALSLLLLVFSCTTNKKDSIVVEKTLFGKLPDGREVYQFTLTNRSGAKARIISYGAAVTLLTMPDRSGRYDDVVLGYDSLQGYLDDKSFLGITAGRYGNRIGKGRFTLDDKNYQLTLNDGEHHLHGGKMGFGKVLWDAKIIEGVSVPAVELTYISKDGEEGYPGTVSMTVVYTLTDSNELRIEYTGTTDRITILNPTHHSYFNLSGSFTNTILDHLLMIEADFITPVNKELITNGKLDSVANSPMDFRIPRPIGSRIDEPYEQLLFGKGYDHNWVLRNYSNSIRRAAELYEPKSGRVMTIYTDQPGLQFYSGNFLDGSIIGKHGIAYKKRTGLCLEAQCFPDSPNKPEFPSVTLFPGKVYHQTTVYRFSTR